MKRASSSETALAPEAKKRKCMYATFSKWKVDMDKECRTVSWLDCDTRSRQAQGGVTPIDSIVTAATAGQSFDRLSSAV